LLTNVITALISAFAAAVLTTWFSLWRFRKERWWERKFLSYVAIIEALHDIGIESDEELEASGTGITISDRRKNELRDKLHGGLNVINKEIHTGEFLLEDDTVEALRSCLREIDDANACVDFISHHEQRSKAVHSCITRVCSLARQELQSETLLSLFRRLRV